MPGHRLSVKALPSRHKRLCSAAFERQRRGRRRQLAQQHRDHSPGGAARRSVEARFQQCHLTCFRLVAEECLIRDQLEREEAVPRAALWGFHLVIQAEVLAQVVNESGDRSCTWAGAEYLQLRLQEAVSRGDIRKSEGGQWNALREAAVESAFKVLQIDEARGRREIVLELVDGVRRLFNDIKFRGAAVHIQRFWRGTIARRTLPERREAHRQLQQWRQRDEADRRRCAEQQREMEAEATDRVDVLWEETCQWSALEVQRAESDAALRPQAMHYIAARIDEVLTFEEPFRSSLRFEERREWAALTRFMLQTLRDAMDRERAMLHEEVMGFYHQREADRQYREGLRQSRLRREAAVTRLQAWTRGCRGRWVATARQQDRERGRLQAVAEVQAQREAFEMAEMERHWKLRAEAERRWQSTIVIQRVWRGHWIRNSRWHRRFRCKLYANAREVLEQQELRQAEEASVRTAQLRTTWLEQRWAPVFLARMELRRRQHHRQEEMAALEAHGAIETVDLAVQLLQRQFRSAIARRFVKQRRDDREEQQSWLRAHEVFRRHLEWEEFHSGQLLARVHRGLTTAEWAEDAQDFWERCEAEAAKERREALCWASRNAQAVVLQSALRALLSEAERWRRAVAAVGRRQRQRQAFEASLPSNQRQRRAGAAGAVQRVYRGFRARQMLPSRMAELRVVTRAERVQRWLIADEKAALWGRLWTEWEAAHQRMRQSAVGLAERKWMALLRIQRWCRHLSAELRSRREEALREEQQLVDRSEALQRRSVLRTEAAQWLDAIGSFQDSTPPPLTALLKQRLEARQQRREEERRSLGTLFEPLASPKTPERRCPSEWTMSKWQFERRQVPADERGVAAAAPKLSASLLLTIM